MKKQILTKNAHFLNNKLTPSVKIYCNAQNNMYNT